MGKKKNKKSDEAGASGDAKKPQPSKPEASTSSQQTKGAGKKKEDGGGEGTKVQTAKAGPSKQQEEISKSEKALGKTEKRDKPKTEMPPPIKEEVARPTSKGAWEAPQGARGAPPSQGAWGMPSSQGASGDSGRSRESTPSQAGSTKSFGKEQYAPRDARANQQSQGARPNQQTQGPQQHRQQQQQQQQKHGQQQHGQQQRGQQQQSGQQQQQRKPQQQQQPQQASQQHHQQQRAQVPSTQTAWGASQPQGPSQSAWGPSRESTPSQGPPQPQGPSQSTWGSSRESTPSQRPPQQRPQQQQQQQQHQQQPQQQQRQPQYKPRDDREQKQGQQKPSQPSLSTAMSKLSINPEELYKRTDVNLKRGTRGKKFPLETNYLNLIINNMIDYAYQYDIKFDPERPKRLLRSAFQEYCRSVRLPPGICLAYDGRSIVYSPIKLKDEFVTTVTVTAVDGFGSKEFKVTLMETINSEIELRSLKQDYRNLPIYEKPMRALQCLDVVLRAPCYGKSVQGGRGTFYNPLKPRVDLSDGYELWLGLFQAAVLGERPLLNIDICHRSFPSAMHLLDIIAGCGGRYSVDLNNSLSGNVLRQMEDFLKGLNIIYKSPKSFGARDKMYKFLEVMSASNRQTFVNEQREKMTVEKYFLQRNVRLQYPHLPCIWVGSREKHIYLPVEFCEIAEGQVSLKKAGPRQVQNMIRYAATSTDERKRKIVSEYNRFNHNADPTLKSFKVQIANDFIKLEGRILDPPQLEYSGKQTLLPSNGSWDPSRARKQFIQASPNLLKCAILILDGYTNIPDAMKFGDMLKSCGRNFGLNLDASKVIKSDSFADKLNQLKGSVDIVFVILSGRNSDSYSSVKQEAEIKCGILTQCIKPDTLSRRMNQSTVNNILLKVNSKLNGLNHKISMQNQTPIMAGNDVMFIGADVTHPSPDQSSIPSVVGVAASHDLIGTKYNIQWRLQDPKKEMIDKMTEIVTAHLRIYEQKNGKLPKKIIYYRDGVSDGQFPQLKLHELRAMDTAFSKIASTYRPTLTCIVVQKRHRTRFFPQRGVGKFNNVPPGTVVDTVITHPNECQFFMVSHESIQGTAKPAKYVVIRDDAKFNIDDLQELTNNMCHLFTRCNRAVSYPAPAYYAHLVAYRGRVYIENSRINLDNLDREYANRKIRNLDETNPMFFV